MKNSNATAGNIVRGTDLSDFFSYEDGLVKLSIDGATLVFEEGTKTIKVDTSALGITIVSEDADNYVIVGSDGGAKIDKTTLEDLIFEKIGQAVSADDSQDGLTFDAVTKMLSTVFKDVTELDSNSIDFTMTTDVDGVHKLTGEVIVDPVAGNKLESTPAGLKVEVPDTIVDSNVDKTASTLTITVDGVDTVLPLQKFTDLAGNNEFYTF